MRFIQKKTKKPKNERKKKSDALQDKIDRPNPNPQPTHKPEKHQTHRVFCFFTRILSVTHRCYDNQALGVTVIISNFKFHYRITTAALQQYVYQI